MLTRFVLTRFRGIARTTTLVAVLIAACCTAACSSSSHPSACTGPKAHGSRLGAPPAPLTATQRHDRNSFIVRDKSHLLLDGKPWRFTGVNMFWLGLDDKSADDSPRYPTHAAVDNGFCAAMRLGATVVRSISLGVSVGSPDSLEPSLGHFNPTALKAIDYAVADARRYGMRLMIPLTDQSHYYSGGKHTFTNWLGHPDVPGQTAGSSAAQQAQEANFYTDPKVIDAFHTYVAHLLNHVNPLTGIRLGADPTIAIWETGNELYDAPTAWTEQTAAFIKSLAPKALIADGSDSSGKDVTQTAVDQPDVDIVDAHFYPTNTAKMRSDASYVAAKQKAYVVGEYPMTGRDVRSWLAALAADNNVSGDLAWSLLPYNANGTPQSHDDGYTFHDPGATSEERRIDTLLCNHARVLRRSTP